MSELPDRLGERFALGPLIGRGTCSQVFRAHDLLLDRPAAVKVFPVADDPRVQREVSLLASLDHPSLVGVYDVGQVAGRAFVVMALFEGGSLADRLRRGPLPLGETILAVSSVADALAHVHRAGVLHRDVTPRNVLFDADGRAHLSDFGVAFVADSPRITDTGIVMGSAPYLSPEQVRGDEVGPPADVYSLGLVMIEALTARPAYVGTPLQAAVARLEQPPRIPEGLGDDLSDLLIEMTADIPSDRPDAESVRLRLRRAALAREVGTPSGPQPVVVPDFEPTRLPTRALMVVGAAAMSVLLAGTVVVASTWTVHDVAASASPPASLSPSASAPLGPLPVPLLAVTGDQEHHSSDDDSASGRFWSAVSESSTRAASARTVEPVERPTPRHETAVEPRPPRSASSSHPTTSESTDETEPTTSRDLPDPATDVETPDVGGIVGGVLRNLPTIGHPTTTTDTTTSDATTTTTTAKRTTTTNTTTTTKSRSLVGGLVDPSGAETSSTTTAPDTTTTTTTTTTKRTPALDALGGLIG